MRLGAEHIGHFVLSSEPGVKSSWWEHEVQMMVAGRVFISSLAGAAGVFFFSSSK